MVTFYLLILSYILCTIRHNRVLIFFQLNLGLELDTGLIGNVVAVSKTQINRPDEASIKTAILHHCIESGNSWDDLLQRKVNL